MRGRWLVAGIGVALLGVVAFAGIAYQATPAAAAQSTSSSDLPGALLGGAAGGPNLFDLGWKTVLVLALLFVTLRVLRRVQHGPAAAGSRLVVLESRALAPKASLHLLAIGERRLVVGLTPGGMVSLAELDAADLPEAGRAKSEDPTATTVPARLLPAGSSGLDRRILQVLSAALGSGR